MKYTTPEMEIVRFEAMDVIVASAGGTCTVDAVVEPEMPGDGD